MLILVGKMLKPLFTPLGFCFVMWLLSALVYWRWSRVWGVRVAAAGIVALYFFSSLIVGDTLLGSLEDAAPEHRGGASF